MDKKAAQSVFIPFVESVKTRALATPVRNESWCFERWETRYCFAVSCLRGIEVGPVIGIGSTGTVLIGKMPNIGTIVVRITPLESYISSFDCRVKKATETKTVERFCEKVKAGTWANELSTSVELSKLQLGPKIFAAWNWYRI